MNQTPLSGPELAAAMKEGTRVVRGADWDWDNQDGNPPGKGTIIKVRDDKWIEVQWDKGEKNCYSMGAEGKYDLTLADPLPKQQQQQSGAATETCCHCKENVDTKDVLFHEKKCLNKPIKSPECSDIVSLKNWYEHQCQTTTKATEKVINDFGNVLDRKEYTDVTIKVKGKEFQLHKSILAGRSPYFDLMFKTEMKEKTTNLVLIDDCEPDIFDSFIYFLYTGKIKELSDNKVCALYVVADKYQENQLKAVCLNFMKNNITIDSFCDFIALALAHEEKELLKNATEFFCGKTNEIIKSVKWQTFLREYPTEANELYIKAYNAK